MAQGHRPPRISAGASAARPLGKRVAAFGDGAGGLYRAASGRGRGTSRCKLLGDQHGTRAEVCRGRECSISAGHQKGGRGDAVSAVFAVAARGDDLGRRRRAKSVGYTNAGTIEYLLGRKDGKFISSSLNRACRSSNPITREW